MRNKYLGVSEDLLLASLQMADDLSPVKMVEDDSDLGEGTRDSQMQGNTGVSNRLMQIKMDFCSDEKRRGKVMWIRISNRPDLLDLASIREGRSDDVIALIPPFHRIEQYRLLYQCIFAREKVPTDIEDFATAAELTAQKIWCTGASIRNLIRRADIYADQDGSDLVQGKHLERAISEWQIAPNRAVQMDAWSLLSIKACDPMFADESWNQIREDIERRQREREQVACVSLPQNTVFPGVKKQKQES